MSTQPRVCLKIPGHSEAPFVKMAYNETGPIVTGKTRKAKHRGVQQVA